MKEKVGDATGDNDLKREGEDDQTAGKVKEHLRRGEEWIEEKGEDIRDKVRR